MFLEQLRLFSASIIRITFSNGANDPKIDFLNYGAVGLEAMDQISSVLEN